MQKKILLITHVRFWTDLINFFLIYKPTSDVDPFDGDFRKLMTRDDLRGYIVFDETPTFIKPFVTFSSVMMGIFTDIDNEGKPCEPELQLSSIIVPASRPFDLCTVRNEIVFPHIDSFISSSFLSHANLMGEPIPNSIL